MKNIAKADRPKSAMAILPPRPFRGSGKVAQAAFKPARRDGKSFIPIVNHFSRDSRILKISPAATFRIAGLPALVLRLLITRHARFEDRLCTILRIRASVASFRKSPLLYPSNHSYARSFPSLV